MKFNSESAIDKAKIETLEKCHRRFGNETWNKLMDSHRDGKTGWDDPAFATVNFTDDLKKAFEDEDWLSVANYALFLWNRKDEKDVSKQDFKQ